MTMKNDNNLIIYAVKKNHIQIYTEFLNFQTLGSSQVHIPIIEQQPLNSKIEKKLNLRNFRALYWITLYLKNIKGHSLILIYEFFIYKNWTTWQFKNFSYHYHKLMKLEHIRQEIQAISNLIQIEQGFSQETIIKPILQVPKETIEPYEPLKLGVHEPSDDITIRPNCSLEESLERLKTSKAKALSKRNTQ